LTYTVNFRFAAKESYTAENVFWGCYRRMGISAPKVYVATSARQSGWPPDIGESEAMIAMVWRLTPPIRQGIKAVFNG
jgi:hypothetical protein